MLDKNDEKYHVLKVTRCLKRKIRLKRVSVQMKNFCDRAISTLIFIRIVRNTLTDCMSLYSVQISLILRKCVQRKTNLKRCLEVKAKCEYITAYDKYGEYGIVGFYAVKDNTLVHFLFSCRTLGMGIEQYTYEKIGCPKLDIVGDSVGQNR